MKIYDKKIITNSSRQTEDLGRKLSQNLKSGDIICLYGDLGSGKTTFVKGLAVGLGIKTRIISPTFVLLREHITKNKNIKTLYHIDLYRLEDEQSIKNLGIEELFENKNSIVVIEWAEKLGNLLPKNRWDIKFESEDEKTRIISINRINN